MIDVLSAAKAHFTLQKSMVVPEWVDPATGEPITVYWKPISVAEMAKVRRMHETVDKDAAMFPVRCLVEKLTDAEGNRLFTIADVDVLFAATASPVLERLAKSILYTETVESAAKN